MGGVSQVTTAPTCMPNHPLDRLGLRFAASGLEPSASIGLFVVPGVAGTFAAVNPRSLGCILALLPLEEAIAVSGVGRSRLYQLFDETREIKSLSLKRSGRTKERQVIYIAKSIRLPEQAGR
jgi:hypothetical protein